MFKYQLFLRSVFLCTYGHEEKGRTWRTRRKVKRDRANGTNERAQVDTSPEVIEFFRWLKRRGFGNEFKLQICGYGAMGRGLCAKRPIKPDECFMDLPLNCMLLASQLRIRHPEMYDIFEQDDICLMAFLTHERTMLDADKPTEWSPCIAIIPRSYEHLLFWQAKAYNKYCNNSAVPQSFRDNLNDVSLDVGRCQTFVQDLIADNNLPLSFDGAIFQWAYTALNNRSVNPNPYYQATAVQDDTAIIPLFDMINHRLNISLRLETSPETGMQLRSQSPFGRYEQIHFTYNLAYSNREYVINYNFCNARAVEAAPRAGVPPEATLRIAPCNQDRIIFRCDELEGILMKGCSSMESSTKKFFKKRIPKRMKFINSAREDYASEKYIFSWPKQLTESDKIVVRFTDTITSPAITYESVHSREDIVLDIATTHLSVPCPDLNYVIKALCMADHEFAELKRAVNEGNEQVAIRIILRTQEELAHYRTLTHSFFRGLLDFEFGIDREVHFDTQLINRHLARIEQSVEHEPLRRVFRNELGLLYYMYLQVLQNAN